MKTHLLVAVFVVSMAGQVVAQESRLFLSVVATKLFVVGAANPMTGVFTQVPSQDTTWTHMGPNTIRAFGVAVHPGSDGKVIYIASGNGVHKSTDGGATWRITTGWKITEVLAVAPDPRNQDVVYCATPYGVFKTSDGCQTWQASSTGIGALFTSCVLVDRSNSSTVYCATEDGAYRSTDAGATWKRMSLSVGGVRYLAQHPRKPEVLAAATESHGLFWTTNGGEWWERREAGIDHNTFYVIGFDPVHPDTVYASGYVTGVYKSLDGGVSWKRMNDGLTTLTFHAIAVDPLDGQRVYAGAYWGGVFRTDNGGRSWRNVGLGDSQVYTLMFQP